MMDNIQGSDFKVLLIGDSCEDEYIYGKCENISLEAPIPIFTYSRTETKVGMSGNVYFNLKSFNIDVTFLTNTEKIVRSRFINEINNTQVFRVDNEQKIKPLILPISANNFDAIIICDYDKGYLTQSKISEIIENSNVPVFVYSKKNNQSDKKNCFFIMDELDYEKICDNFYMDNLIIIKGCKGSVYKHTFYKAENNEIFNMIGTDNIFISTLVYGYLRYKNIKDALILANKSLSISTKKFGTYILSEKDILSLKKK